MMKEKHREREKVVDMPAASESGGTNLFNQRKRVLKSVIIFHEAVSRAPSITNLEREYSVRYTALFTFFNCPLHPGQRVVPPSLLYFKMLSDALWAGHCSCSTMEHRRQWKMRRVLWSL